MRAFSLVSRITQRMPEPGYGRAVGGNAVAESFFASIMGGLFDARSWSARGCQLFCHTWLVGRGDGDGMAGGPLRLAELLVGLSGIADVGMGMEQGEAARAALLGVRLADALGVRERSDVYYVTLLQHIGCTAYAHEAAALLGGSNSRSKAAAIQTDFGSASDVLLGYLPRLAPGAGGLTRLRAGGRV